MQHNTIIKQNKRQKHFKDDSSNPTYDGARFLLFSYSALLQLLSGPIAQEVDEHEKYVETKSHISLL